MSAGTVNADREVLLELTVRGPAPHERDVEALLDTGFNGFLALPPAWIAALHLETIGQAQMVLASGEERRVQKHEAVVVSDAFDQSVEVVEAADPLIGTELLWGCSLHVDFVLGGRVEVGTLT